MADKRWRDVPNTPLPLLSTDLLVFSRVALGVNGTGKGTINALKAVTDIGLIPSGNNTVFVRSLSDLPTPAANLISLNTPDTTYVFLNSLGLGNNALNVTVDKLTFSAGFNKPIRITNNTPGTRVLILTASGTNFACHDIIFGDGTNLATVDITPQGASSLVQFINCKVLAAGMSLRGGTQNLIIRGGRWDRRLNLMSSTDLQNWLIEDIDILGPSSGTTFFEIGGATIGNVTFKNCRYTDPTNQEFFIGDFPSTATFPGLLRVEDCILKGRSDMLRNITPKDAGVWFRGNQGADDVGDSKYIGGVIVKDNTSVVTPFINPNIDEFIKVGLADVAVSSDTQRFTFTHTGATNRLQLTSNATDEQKGVVRFHLTVIRNVPGFSGLEFSIYKNSVRLTEAFGSTEMTSSPAEISFEMPVTHKSGDVFEIAVRNKTDSVSLFVNYMQWYIL